MVEGESDLCGQKTRDGREEREKEREEGGMENGKNGRKRRKLLGLIMFVTIQDISLFMIDRTYEVLVCPFPDLRRCNEAPVCKSPSRVSLTYAGQDGGI